MAELSRDYVWLVTPKGAARADVGRGRGRGGIGRQIGLQLICLVIGITVLFPVLWIVAMAVDPRNLQRPDSLFPPGASLDAFARVIAKPTENPVSFLTLAANSLF